ncbi:uncharacterized protein LOC119810221 isoform X2 [Arvicola amphibius]|uniref:uncharacterized protein LOC119810221 isoform X2 n=1 Tax=Arvicola amphibius TaxID=1047088 RepID=UPI0018E2B66D|nr:uncharacterized protein LOC119810221 isoform X2 [Arvicola amphibius]
MSMCGQEHKRSQGPSGREDTREEQDENRNRARMQLRFPMNFQRIGGNIPGLLPTFKDFSILQPIRLESWVFKGLFGFDHALMPLFEMTYKVLIVVGLEEHGMALYVYGMRMDRIVVLYLIVSLACDLRMKRNRARAWARGLQSPVRWSLRRYFI